jgi:hypothetical protein
MQVREILLKMKKDFGFIIMKQIHVNADSYASSDLKNDLKTKIYIHVILGFLRPKNCRLAISAASPLAIAYFIT